MAATTTASQTRDSGAWGGVLSYRPFYIKKENILFIVQCLPSWYFGGCLSWCPWSGCGVVGGGAVAASSRDLGGGGVEGGGAGRAYL